MEKKLKKVGDRYEMTTSFSEEELLLKRTRAIKNIRDIQAMMGMRKSLLSEINLALGKDAEDETEIR